MSEKKQIKAKFRRVMDWSSTKESLARNVWSFYGVLSVRGEHGAWMIERGAAGHRQPIFFTKAQSLWLREDYENTELIINWLLRKTAKRSEKLPNEEVVTD